MDPLSNTLIVSDVDMERWVHDMGSVGRFPRAAVPKFLHEMTHHWCFNSPVGFALQLLTFRAVHRQCDANKPNKSDHPFSRSAAIDLFKVNFWQGLMQPMTEGLALFAEHDATTGESPTISGPLEAMSFLATGYFSGVRVATGRQRYDNLDKVLAHVRMNEAHFRRKANLLLEPLDTEASPYLCGYLALKALHIEALLRNSRFLDKDLFLLFMKSYIFDDWRTVDLLLDDTDSSPEEIARDLVVHCDAAFTRIEDAFDDEAVLETFLNRALNERSDRCLFTHSMGSVDFSFYSDPVFPASESERGHARLRSLIDDVLFPSDDPTRELISALQFSIISVRSVLTLGRATFRADLKEFGRLIVWRENESIPHAAFPVSEERVEPWSGQVTAVLAYSTATRSTHLIYLRDAEFLAALPPLDDGDDKLALSSAFIDPVQRLEKMSILNGMIEIPISVASAWRSQLWDKYGTRFHKIFVNIALCRASDRRRTSAALAESGFLNALPDGVDSIEQLAALSLSAYFPGYPDTCLPTLACARAAIDTIGAALENLYGCDPLFRKSGEVDLMLSLI